MKNFNKYLLSFALVGSISAFAQDATEGEPTTIQGLLQLVQEGRTSEQTVNTKREADFLVDKNKQASKLAAEKREL
ncbi:MAG: MotA/TolQ/ExbB proton channel family protein, partial [Nitrosomonadales bacterium]|nr:MotA/TolQ/ExbB proton channel family protein [Nitrosomonadales bacterium]